ncbi:MAG TPA: hypothetical protein VMV55_00710 [Methanoregula sp.]|nr:hypothetical protein [Methanoregula sp.]
MPFLPKEKMATTEQKIRMLRVVITNASDQITQNQSWSFMVEFIRHIVDRQIYRGESFCTGCNLSSDGSRLASGAVHARNTIDQVFTGSLSKSLSKNLSIAPISIKALSFTGYLSK